MCEGGEGKKMSGKKRMKKRNRDGEERKSK